MLSSDKVGTNLPIFTNFAAMQDLNNEPENTSLMDGIMTVNDEPQVDESLLSVAQAPQPSVDRLRMFKTLISYLSHAMFGKTAVGISLLSAICLGSFKLYNFCIELNKRKQTNQLKIKDIVSKLPSLAINQRSPLIIKGLESTLEKLDDTHRSCSRFYREVKLLKTARNTSEEVFVYLSSETYIPITQGYSEYEKLKSEIRKLKGQILSCRNFPSLR